MNTKGKNEDEVSKELIDFLHYIECTDEAVALKSGSENIKKIHECVKRIKSSEEMGVKYMQTWEEKILDREKGRQEGIDQGIRIFVESCLEFGISREDILEKIYKKFSLTKDEAEKYLDHIVSNIK